jgi:hypothetical protein
MFTVTRRCRFAAGLVVGLLGLTWSGVATASPRPLPLSARLLGNGDLVGFHPESKTTSFSTAKAWVAGGPHASAAQQAADIARLKKEGFVAVLSEFLDRGAEKGSGLSWVMQLGSAAAARAERKRDLAEYEAAGGGSFTTFSVPMIPGARGYLESGGGSGGENILFADGPFLFLVGQGWSASEKKPTRAGLIAAANKLYERVHGHPAG